MTVLEQGRVVADDWPVLADDEAAPVGLTSIVSLARFRGPALPNGPVGVLLEPEAEADDLADVTARAALVAVRFPIFRDGRGFSTARRLRERGFAGILRAMGHLLPDQHVFLLRCGFDQVLVGPDQELSAWTDALGAFSFAYQPAVLAETTGFGLRRLRPGVAAGR